MGWPFSESIKTTPRPEESLYNQEMCDVCGHTYYYQNIRRIRYINPRGTIYVIRCCQYCNINTIIKYL